MKNRCIIKTSFAILALTLSVAFSFVACTKEPKEPAGRITMTTKASKVELGVEGTKDVTIDWGDGKKNNVNDALYDEGTKMFWFTHDYSGANPRYIAVTGNITKLSCSNNELTALDVSGSTGLTTLNCGFNQLTALDVSKNTALELLSVHHNQLTALDVSKNTALIGLGCDNNRLSNLSVNVTALGSLDCSNNELTASALNDLFRALPDRTKTKGYSENPELYVGFIWIRGNPGGGDCDSSIAQKKGWKFMIR